MDAKVSPAARKPVHQTENLAQEAIEEARMMLPGIQALFGFQLIAVFNERFHQLTEADQVLHYIALLLVALAIAIIMTPAAYHRLGTGDRDGILRPICLLAYCCRHGPAHARPGVGNLLVGTNCSS